MRKTIWLVMFVMAGFKGFAQTPLETLIGNKQVQYLHYWQRDLDSAGRFNFFNLNSFAIDYRDNTRNSVSIEGQLTYQIKPWLGISAGGGFEGERFTPSLGLSFSYANRQGDFVVETYPTIQLSKPVAVDFFGVLVYTPQFSRNWGLFSQLIFSTNLGIEKTPATPNREVLGIFTQHNQSTQLLRIGLNYQQRIQFGFGADFYQFGHGVGVFSNIGVFLRYVIE